MSSWSKVSSKGIVLVMSVLKVFLREDRLKLVHFIR